MSTSIRDVGAGHYSAFTTALTNLLSTAIAEQTYAEIVDVSTGSHSILVVRV